MGRTCYAQLEVTFLAATFATRVSQEQDHFELSCRSVAPFHRRRDEASRHLTILDQPNPSIGDPREGIENPMSYETSAPDAVDGTLLGPLTVIRSILKLKHAFRLGLALGVGLVHWPFLHISKGHRTRRIFEGGVGEG